MPSEVGLSMADEETGAALEAEGLTLSWDGQTTIVQGVDLSVRPGEIACLVGKSGCGKTTILHALAGLTEPCAGRVLLHGKDVTGTPGQVSYMLQKDLLLPHLTILDNVCLPLTIKGMAMKAARAQAAPLFERFGLSGTEQRWPAQLSGGMRQRAAFMRTYLMGNDVVLLDEPFSALDAITRAELRGWYCTMSRELGLASVVITHDVDEAVLMADRIHVLVGSPATGVPTTVGAVVVPERCEAFELSEPYLEAKRAVLAALEMS